MPILKIASRQLIIGLPKSENEFKKQGIPSAHMKAFADVAQQKRCVILTRTPGETCGQLLQEGYDAKGFHIKGKSQAT